ncbi:MAG: WS/DGAT/MGAT family O-acyltransferase [Microthrixaceae bacterium]
MERLSGMDATFLYVETPEAHMHVAMTGIYDVTTMEGGYSFESIKEHIRARLHLVPPFRRRLVQVPFQFHHPVWIEDPNFDLDYHVRRIGCPAPGGRRELADVAAQIASIPLDRSRPLWEAWVIEGLKHDRIGFVVKVHHAAIDGASGAEIMTEMYDLSVEGRDLHPEPVEPERIPTDQELLTYAALSKLRRASDSVALVRRTVENVSSLVQSLRTPGTTHGAVPLTAPRAPWNHSIGPHRTVSFARLPLDRTKAVKAALDVKLNDVILAVCSGTLRRYLDEHHELPEESLIATCPVSVRVDDEAGSNGNKVSAMFASLATDVEDPVKRVEEISRSTGGAKSDHDMIGARTLTDWAEWAAPRTFGLAARLYGSMNDSLRPIHNLVISNVPGPPFPLYLGGAELVAAYPMGPIMDGAGLNITVLSYRNHIDIGFLADRDLVPDVWHLAEAVQPAFDELVSVAEATNPTAVKSAAPVTATSKSAKQASRPRSGSARKQVGQEGSRLNR